MKLEWRKQEKALYGAKTRPALIHVPEQKFIMVKGAGNPNHPDFSDRVSALFSLAYAIKMNVKTAALQEETPGEIQDYAVYPLEGVWRQNGDGKGLVKENLDYTIMIRQPDFVTEEMVKAALERVKVKAPNPLYEEIGFRCLQGGTCIEMLHLGSYDSEPDSFAKMDQFAKENGWERVSDCHREIYLNSAARTKPDNLKTILRYKVKESLRGGFEENTVFRG